MKNYYIADCHFGHAKVLEFDGRPFSSAAEMEETMIANWNAVVRPEDTVHIVGDFCWGKAEEWLRIVRQLQGRKVLIKGNHDLKQYPAELEKEFVAIKDYLEVSDVGADGRNRKVILSHYPMMFYKHSNNRWYYMLFGHVHMSAENDRFELWRAELRAAAANGNEGYTNQGQLYNVGCMLPYMNYAPRTLDQIICGAEEYYE